jgi:hypothetical protein
MLRYEFGFGLSYKKFTYTNLEIVANVYENDTNAQLEAAWVAGHPTSSIFTIDWLHIVAVNVTFNLQNTGAVAGTEIPQVYLHYPGNSGEPLAILRGLQTLSCSLERPRSSQPISHTMICQSGTQQAS